MSKISRQFLGYIGTPPLDLEAEVAKVVETLTPAESQLLAEHLSLTNQDEAPTTEEK